MPDYTGSRSDMAKGSPAMNRRVFLVGLIGGSVGLVGSPVDARPRKTRLYPSTQVFPSATVYPGKG